MLEAVKVNKTFMRGVNAVHALKGVDMRISEGERVYIHGPSGAGKSTFLHILGGLDVPTSGSVSFRGRNVNAMFEWKRSRVRNRCFGFIFQFYHLLPELNVLENVMMPAMIKGGEPKRGIRSRAVKLLETVGMGGRLRHRPSEISGGEAQRVAIARALINSPAALFCDEPTGNLDSAMSAQIYALIRDISDKSGMSVVVVSHQDVDKDFFHSEYVMKDGILEKSARTMEHVVTV
ncbi:MAG: ABC transporter ATP-binding protein [Candidatus Omnitrophota bacterium]